MRDICLWLSFCHVLARSLAHLLTLHVRAYARELSRFLADVLHCVLFLAGGGKKSAWKTGLSDWVKGLSLGIISTFSFS